MKLQEQRDTIITELETLNELMKRQMSFPRVFLVGIIQGLGFFIGSAIIATIALGVLGPWVGKIGWVHDMFEIGRELK